jgi:RHS repeat-associated protein
MRFKKIISSFLSAVMIFGNSLVPALGLLEEFAAPALRIGLPAFVGSVLLTTKIAYARTTRNWSNAPKELQTSFNTLNSDPTDQELAAFRAFETPFYPTSGPEQENENHDLGEAIQKTLTEKTDARVDYLENFVKAHPQSRWVLAAELNNGILLYKHGYFSRALRAFYTACVAGGKETTSYQAAALANRALAEAIRINCRVGRRDMAQTLLTQLQARHPSGLAARYAENAMKVIQLMDMEPGKSFFCGPFALQSILRYQHSKLADSPIIKEAQSTKDGYSLDKVWEMSESLGMDMQIAKRGPGAKVIVPAVVNWKLNHYAALVEEKNGLFHSIDPTFGNETWVSEKALDQEGSGYYLVPNGPLPTGWTTVSMDEASKVFGKGNVNAQDPPPPCPPTAGSGGSSGGVGSNPPPPPCGGAGGGGGSSGMPVADIDLFMDSPMLSDTPIGYHPPIGPDINIHVSYDGGSVVTLPFSNFGQNWAFNWQGFIQADFVSGVGVSGYTLFNPGGGQEEITFGQYSRYSQSSFTSTGSIMERDGVAGDVAFIVPASIQRTLPDGSAEIYSIASLFSGQQNLKYLLTQVIDPKGNVVTLNYDSSCHLISIVDAIGQTTTFTYGNPNDPYGITQVTDPFGRSAFFNYDNHYNLISITDVMGMTSQMAYETIPQTSYLYIQIPPGELEEGGSAFNNTNDEIQLANNTWSKPDRIDDVEKGVIDEKSYIYSEDGISVANGGSAQVYVSGDAIQSLTTPYGTTQFTYGEDVVGYGSGSSYSNPYVEITDPLQEKEKVEFEQALNTAGNGNETSPPGGLGTDSYANSRNTYLWNKKAMADDPNDPASAKVYHWLHSVDGTTEQMAPIIETLKNPNESTIWYVYPGQVDQGDESSNTMPATPSVVTRYVNNGGTAAAQEYLYQYNGYGKVTNYTDPNGRVFTYTYAANGQDLLNVQDSNSEILSSYTYDSSHDPLTYKDASGQMWNYSYNNAGQITSSSAPMGETTKYNYDSNGHLISVVPPQPGSTVTYTYDPVGRVHTQTDTAHGTMTYTYDNLDRVTEVSYSDGTSETYRYTYLDLTTYKDRQNRTTTYTYDGDRHMTSVMDPKSQMTQFGWCSCGSLASMTDPSGNETAWNRDFEGRVTQKIYPDGSNTTYNWDQNGSQLLSVQDARNEFTNYTYDLDNELETVAYSGPVTGTSNVDFSYDPTLPRLTSMSDGTGTTNYSYYPIGSTGGGHVQTVASPVGTATANITYVYDNDGRTAKRSIDSNSENYIYTNDELTAVSNPLGAFGYSYDPNTSNLTQITYPNGQKTNMTYYQPGNPLGAGRLETLTNLGAGTTSGQTLSSFSYSYTQAGDISTWTQQLDNTPADSHTYTMGYDKDSELTSATLSSGTKGFDGLTANKGVTFGYDASGNRTSEQTSTYTNTFGKNSLNQLTGITPNPIPVQGSTNKPANVFVNGQGVTEDTNNNFSGSVTPVGGSTPMTIRAMASDGTQATQTNHVLSTQAYTYDANGSISSDNMYSYTYDANNRLIQVNFLNPQPATKPDTVQMTYDGLGRRVAITELHGTTVITATTDVWCGSDVCQERDITGHTVTKQFFSLGEQVSGTNYYFACDYLGSIREMTDASGVVHANYDYDAFGRQTKLSGDLDSDFGFTAFGIEKTLCLDLTYFRVYDPEKGRWLTRDPMGENVGFNLYGYVDNNTIKYTDSLGLVASGSGNSPRGYKGPPPTPGDVKLICDCGLFVCSFIAPELPFILDSTDLGLFVVGTYSKNMTPINQFIIASVGAGKGYLGILNDLNQINNPPTPQQNPPNSCNNPPPNQHHYGGE